MCFYVSIIHTNRYRAGEIRPDKNEPKHINASTKVTSYHIITSPQQHAHDNYDLNDGYNLKKYRII